MDNSDYVNDNDSLQWIPETHSHHNHHLQRQHQHQHNHHERFKNIMEKNVNANAPGITLNSQSSELSSNDNLIVNNENYLVPHERDHGTNDNVTNIDQIAAENLILMAHDGQMMTTNIITNANDTIVVASNGGTPIHCETIMRQSDLIIQADESNATSIIYSNAQSIEHYIDNTPQMVTEEIITDDWVQHQGEERVEIPAEQIIGSGSHILLDMEVPLSTVQDEYSVLRPYPCDFCSRRFRKKASLMNHMVAHQNDRPHLCKLCNSRFLHRQDLINHLKAHAEEELALEDNDFLHFDSGVDATSGVNQRRLTNDNEYDEQNWNISNESIPMYIKNSPKSNGDIAIVTTTVTESNFTFNSITNQARMGVSEMTYDGGRDNGQGDNDDNKRSISRGRISRLKPKHNISYDGINVDACGGNDDGNNGIEYMHNTENRVDEKNSMKQMQQKSAITSKRKPFVCQRCGLAFAREKALIAHGKKHRQEDSYECNHCHEIFWNNENLREHLMIHQFEDSDSEYEPNDGDCDIEHNDIKDDDDRNSKMKNAKSSISELNSEKSRKFYNDFYCNECGISFHRMERLKTHAKLHKKKEKEKTVIDKKCDFNNKINSNSSQKQMLHRHSCHTCGETFAEALDLLAHAEVHARFPTFKCVLCGETFIEEITIKRHLQARHSNEMTENSCILCGKECRDRKALIKHAWDHSLEKCHTCTKCGKNFHNKARLKRHWASHRDKSVQCEICREEFPDGRTLSNHRHSHSTTSNGKLFPCSECGKTFGSRSSQQIHLRIHTGEKPYGCRYCWKAFADGGTLRKHERIHTGEKPYACTVCTRAFNQRVVLREHIRSHHSAIDNNRGTYFCHVCSVDMSTSRELIQHLIEHSDANTAKQRQPVTGPRKYKRRRKLKPHELVRLKDESKLGVDFGNFNDYDMTDIDEIFTLNGASSLTSKNNNQNAPNNDHKEKAKNKRGKEEKNTKNEKHESNCEVDVDLDVDVINWCNHLNETNKLKKVTQSMTTITTATTTTTSAAAVAATITAYQKESIFNKLKNTLNRSNNDLPDVHRKRILRRKQMYNLNKSTQNTKTAKQLIKIPIKMDNTINMAKGKGPKMKYTTRRNETKIRYKESLENENKSRKRSKSIKKDLVALLSRTSSTIVDDYDIISPELQPPKQISCSPVNIKQEDRHEIERQLKHYHQQLQSPSQSQKVQVGREKIKQNHELKMNNQNQNSRMMHNATTTAPNDIYDAHLLLEASGLRHDLDDMILLTPIKMGKDERQQHYTSESSFMADQTVEEQLLIKIEPTSPDLREIVNGVVNMINNNNNNYTNNNNCNNDNCTSDIEKLEHHVKRKCNGVDTGSREENSKQRRQQQEKQKDLRMKKDVACNLKYSTANNSNNSNNNNKTFNLETTATSMPNKTSSALSASSATSNVASYLDYNVYRATHGKSSSISTTFVANDNINKNSSIANNTNNEFDSINAVVSAADANEAATAAVQKQQQQQPHQKHQQHQDEQQHQSVRFRRYFECEMCSMVFSDRAQLLDHVPIHI